MIRFNIIFASDEKLGIGLNNCIPWKCTEGLQFFKKITNSTIVIMGRKTWESLPKRPLPNCINIVLSRTKDYAIIGGGNTTQFCSSATSARKICLSYPHQQVFVIGGAQIYRLFLEKARSDPEHYKCERIYHTKIKGNYKCDTFFPNKLLSVDQLDRNVLSEMAAVYEYSYSIPTINKQERAYLDLLREIRDTGEEKDDRTGTGTISVFGRQLRFSLSNNIFPLLTSKRMFLRGIIEELLFFIRGDTNNDNLNKKNVHIWDGNTSRAYLDSIGLEHYEEGSLAASYGHQWRHWGAPYETKHTDYTGKGIDQLAEVVRLIREEPTSRRIIISGWNVSQLKEMALVPCHMVYQFNVNLKKNELNCMMTQRSADMFLGVPFNIASTALFTVLLAKVTGYHPGEIVINFGDTHIYKNHLNQVERQLKRNPYPFPTIEIAKELNSIHDIEQLEYDDFHLKEYQYHPGIKAKMAV